MEIVLLLCIIINLSFSLVYFSCTFYLIAPLICSLILVRVSQHISSSPPLQLVCSQSGSQFGVPLSRLIPEKSEKVPAVLETCFQYIESHGA